MECRRSEARSEQSGVGSLSRHCTVPPVTAIHICDSNDEFGHANNWSCLFRMKFSYLCFFAFPLVHAIASSHQDRTFSHSVDNPRQLALSVDNHSRTYTPDTPL